MRLEKATINIGKKKRQVLPSLQYLGSICYLLYIHPITFLLFNLFVTEHCYFIITHLIPHVSFEVALLITLSILKMILSKFQMIKFI
jgi:hypothetical protein